MTLQATAANYLISLGWEETKPLTGCRVFTKPGKDGKFFLGKRGSVRYGRTRSESRAAPLIGQWDWMSKR